MNDKEKDEKDKVWHKEDVDGMMMMKYCRWKSTYEWILSSF